MASVVVEHHQESSLSHLVVIGDEAQVEEGTFTAKGPDTLESNAIIEADGDAQVVASGHTLITDSESAAVHAAKEELGGSNNSTMAAEAKYDDDDKLFDWVYKLLAICVGAMAVILQDLDTSLPLPVTFYFASLAMIIVLIALSISKNLLRTTQDRFVPALLHVGQFFGFTSVFLFFHIVFPLYFKMVSWFLYLISILVVGLFKYSQHTGNGRD